MIHKKLFLLLWCGALSAGAAEIIGFDADWRFYRGDVFGAEQMAFDASAWAKIDVPHDWTISGPFAQTNLTGGAGAYLPSGVAWYRKEFVIPKADADRRVVIQFDGVMANSDVWLNGRHLSHRPCGYVSFADDLTSNIIIGGTNLVAVRDDVSQQPASRWYAGAGIYRHVWLRLSNPIHLEQWSPFIIATNSTVHAQATIVNDGSDERSVALVVRIRDANGVVAETTSEPRKILPGQSISFQLATTVSQPKLWELDHPHLYTAQFLVREGQGTLDRESVPFGIREFHFDPATGFWMNGKNIRLKGVCLHADGSCFGAAVPLDIWRDRLEQLRALGVNAIRTAHNPPAPEFLDLCDQMGFLVMDEFFDCWTVGKRPFDYHLYFNRWSKIDERDMIRRDRNHPSIILWSVGNEIHDTPHAALARGILTGLVKICHENDPSRPVTQALFRPNSSGDYTNGLADLLDVIGTNYRDEELLAAQRAKPSRKIIGTEERHDVATWLKFRDHPQIAGQFLWSGIDYLGESRHWPIIAAGSGLLDRCGWIKPMGYQRQSWWSDKPMVFIARRVRAERAETGDPGFNPLDRPRSLFADWTPRDQSPHSETVEAYSNCQEVELRLNGQSLGSKPLPSDAAPRVWEVPFVPGELEAVGKNEGQVAAQWSLRTAGPARKILLTKNQDALRPDWNSVIEVRAQVVDDHDVTVPNARNEIAFTSSGPGVVAAVDSADNSSHEPFQAARRRAFEGQCAAMIKATAGGTIQITASAPGLEPATISLPAAAR